MVLVFKWEIKVKIGAKGKGYIKLEHGKFKYVLYVPSLATNMLSVYQMTHTSSPKWVIFGLDLIEITNISTGNIIEKGAVNHASKAYEFSHFMPFSDSVYSQKPLVREGKQIPSTFFFVSTCIAKPVVSVYDIEIQGDSDLVPIPTSKQEARKIIGNPSDT